MLTKRSKWIGDDDPAILTRAVDITIAKLLEGSELRIRFPTEEYIRASKFITNQKIQLK